MPINFYINVPDGQLKAVKAFIEACPEPTSVQKMANTLGINVNRLRYILDTLVTNNEVAKIQIDDRPNHKRYSYKVIK